MTPFRSRFCGYDLRTTDPDAARAFYAEAVGLDVPDGLSVLEKAVAETAVAAWPLHEQARARGAPPHWLGHVGVADVEATLARFVERGSEQLGPLGRTRDGTLYARLRDSSGAVLSLRAQTEAPASPVAWHQLHTRDLDHAYRTYTEIFGWETTGRIDVPDPPGGHCLFGWAGEKRSAGAIANTARWPGVHPHWLYFFAVRDIANVAERVREKGGRLSAPPVTLPDGAKLVPCEDPQGAAFGLYEAPPSRGR